MTSLPLFPLPLVLFPEGRLPLRIFEPRYLDMVRDCMRHGTPFGVVCAFPPPDDAPSRAGSVATLGTAARIVDFDALDDGLLGIQCVGAERFRVESRRQQRDGLWVGEVAWRPQAPAQTVPPAYGLLARIVSHIGELPEQPFGAVTADRYDNADWVGFRLAEVLPLELVERQLLLEMDTPGERLQWLLDSLQRFQSAS
jgi:Lon protease-like protein